MMVLLRWAVATMVSRSSSACERMRRLSTQARYEEAATVRDRMVNGLGIDVVGSTPVEFASFLDAQIETWGRVVRERNIKAQLDAGMSDADACALLAENGMLVKRPLLVGDDFVLVGFKPEAWEQALLAGDR